MIKDINDFITIVRQKNGRVKITHDKKNERNIYRLMHELGYRKSKLDNKRFYYLREGAELLPSSVRQIKGAFLEYLRNFDFKNIPDDIDYSSVLDWYHERQPIKVNGLFDHYLEEELNETEAHYLKLKTNADYKHKNDIKILLSKFDEWNFSKTIDIVGAFCEDKDSPLFYKKIGENKYLIFIHFNSKHNTNDGFDCWLTNFVNEKHIGRKKPLSIEPLRLGFRLDRDFELISDYLS